MNPSPLFIFHRKHAIDMMTNTNIMNRIVMEQTMPTEFTSTGLPYITPYSNQGTGNLENRSIETLTASRPCWFIINKSTTRGSNCDSTFKTMLHFLYNFLLFEFLRIKDSIAQVVYYFFRGWGNATTHALTRRWRRIYCCRLMRRQPCRRNPSAQQWRKWWDRE